MKWALIIVGVIAGLIALVFLIGSLLPKTHLATRMARFKQSPDAAWDAISGIERFTSWRTGLKSVERLADRDGKPVWRETSGFGAMTLETIEWAPGRRLVCRIADKDLPFGGTWTYEVAPEPGGGCSVRITENGEIRPALFRFMARFIFGYTKTMDDYLKSLGTKFGETTQTLP